MMRLRVIEAVSTPSGTVNEDRIGQAGALAWVIDGATDILEERILPGPSDAAWLAARIDRYLAGIAARSLAEGEGEAACASADGLTALLGEVTRDAAAAFARERLRPPAARHELPSASGILMALGEGRLDALSLGDCQLLLKRPSGEMAILGTHPGLAAGDRETMAAVKKIQTDTGATGWAEMRQRLGPRLRQGRAGLNMPGGYGVFSVEPVPAEFVVPVAAPVEPGALILLASDGFTRLTDVYGRHGLGDLVDLAVRRGLADLLAEIRAIEAEDPQCLLIPRAKPRDDASAMLIEVTA